MLEVWLSEYLPRSLASARRQRETDRRLSMRSYAVITPVRDEGENLPRLAREPGCADASSRGSG